MEAVGAASAILAIATAGVQCSVKLVTFAGQVKTAAEQITMVAEEVSLNASILQQLGELAKENIEDKPPVSDDNGNNTINNTVESLQDTKTTVSKQSIFNATGLETVMNLAKKCEDIFESLRQSLRKASKQLHVKSGTPGKVKLSRTEMFKWPFLAPGMDTMRSELRNVKGTLMLMLQVAMLAYSRRMMEGYGENIQRRTAIVAYSREDQELLVRSIVAAQKAQLGSSGKETSGAFNVRSVMERPLERHRPGFSQLSGQQGPATMDPGLNGTAESARKDPDPNLENNIYDEPSRDNGSGFNREDDSNKRIPLSRQPSPYPSQIFTSSPSRIFSIYLISPRAFVTNHQIHITYDARIVKLPDSTIESKLQEWKVSLNTTVLDQLAALNINEYEALDATRNRSDWTMLQEETLEWIQFGDYHTLIQGIEYLKARTLTMIMSGVPQPTSRFEEEKEKKEEKARPTWIRVRRKHLLPETLMEYGLPWDWDESDPNYLVIKRWLTEDFQEELFAHTRRLRESKIMKQTSATMTDLKGNDRNKDEMYLTRKRSRSRRRSVSKIRQSIRLINTRKQEQEDMEQTLDDEAEADTKDDEFRERLRREFEYTREEAETETILDQKTADAEKKWKREERKEVKQEKDQQAEEETNGGEFDEALSESDDAEGIVDALLARYTM